MRKYSPLKKSVSHLLIPNRAEIAIRIARTANALGIPTTTLYTEDDRDSPHVRLSRQSRRVKSYLDVNEILRVAREVGADAIHPGYGFLSENAMFVKAIEDAKGIAFLGPNSDVIASMGSKSKSKVLMIGAGVRCVPGYHGSNQDPQVLLSEAKKIGFPVLIKAIKGGGGKGMRIVGSHEEFLDQLQSAKSEANSSFGDDGVIVEKYITRPRHVEVQIFGDSHGNVISLGERDCSVQRRHQKIIEESPAPNLDGDIRLKLHEAARSAGKAVGYSGAGTVEFIFDVDSGEFYFMEMNTRLQVEHPVTEMVTGTDLVEWGLIVANGGRLPLTQEQVAIKGHSFEARIYAENPTRDGFVPQSGPLLHVKEPPKTLARLDSGFGQGDEVSSNFDPMISKLIVHGRSRGEALRKLRLALEDYEIIGPATNIEFLKRLCVSEGFVAGDVETNYISKHESELFAIPTAPHEVLIQGAMAILHHQSHKASASDPFALLGGAAFPVGTMQSRTMHLKDGERTVEVTIIQKGNSMYDLRIDNVVYSNVLSASTQSHETNSYLPHTRLSSTTIFSGDHVTVVYNGLKYVLEIPPASWLAKVAGKQEKKNSVFAPMPCKVIRYEVQKGDLVKQNAVLVVIESMKMETTIRAPADAKIKRIPHTVGDIVTQGTALVEFDTE